jgi:hypothetical protein
LIKFFILKTDITNPFLIGPPSMVYLTATMLGMAIATHYDVKAKILEWLSKQGVKKFHFVAITPPDTLLDLSITGCLIHLMDVYFGTDAGVCARMVLL